MRKLFFGIIGLLLLLILLSGQVYSQKAECSLDDPRLIEALKASAFRSGVLGNSVSPVKSINFDNDLLVSSGSYSYTELYSWLSNYHQGVYVLGKIAHPIYHVIDYHIDSSSTSAIIIRVQYDGLFYPIWCTYKVSLVKKFGKTFVESVSVDEEGDVANSFVTWNMASSSEYSTEYSSRGNYLKGFYGFDSYSSLPLDKRAGFALWLRFLSFRDN